MASEIRVNKLNSQTGVGTITLSPTGVDISGITTAETLKVGTGVTASSDGDIFATGITTVSGNVKVGTGITLSPDGDAFFTGVCTATSFSGDGSNLTGISGVSLSGSTNNTVATVTGANALIGEGNLKFDGTNLGVGVDPSGVASYSTIHLKGQTSGNGGAIRLTDHGDTPDSDDFTIYKNSASGYLRINGTDPLIAYLNGADRLKIESDGDTTISTGNLVIGTSGKGIDFSAESGSAAGSSSALLDDYEQGSFTATMSNGVTLHSGDDVVYYIKVGNLVTIQAEIRINSSNSNADTVINNLPFVATNHNGNFCPGPVGTYDHTLNSGTSFAFVKTTKNTSTASFQCAGQDGTFRNLDAYGNGYLAFTLVYFTTF